MDKKKKDPLLIDCGEHGKKISTIVCIHLLNCKIKVGFIENCSDPNDLQAWCYACEYLFEQEGNKTETFLSFNNSCAVCIDCYEKIKEFNSIK